MREQHKSHIVSTYSTVMQHLAEIRQVAATGKTPGGGEVAPLPDRMREPFFGELEVVAARLEDLVESSVPDRNQARSESGGVGAALMWVNVLLRTVEELIRDLLPDSMCRHYGELSPAEARRLQAGVDRVLGSLHESMLLTEQRNGSRGERPESSHW